MDLPALLIKYIHWSLDHAYASGYKDRRNIANRALGVWAFGLWLIDNGGVVFSPEQQVEYSRLYQRASFASTVIGQEEKRGNADED